jgi:cyclic pyranopterin phosphate synthase
MFAPMSEPDATASARPAILDRRGRPMRSLRLSVTDRCNLRCAYCMPEASYVWLPRGDLLSYEELGELADVFLSLGVDKIRLTGGEPLLRRDVEVLIGALAAKPALADLALTTNGVHLAGRARSLRACGLQRLTVSLDTLRPDVFRALAQRDELARVLAGIDDAARAGFGALKLDTVVLRGTNDGELADLLEFARERGAELRFIEYMDVGGATRWSRESVVTRAEILARLAERYGPPEPLGEQGSAPAERFRLPDGLTFGVIASTSTPFCGACDRSRLTADGMWYLCLYARVGIDLRGLLRGGATADELRAVLARGWGERSARGAEERLAAEERSALADAVELRADPHLEMHTRGG